MVDVFVTRNGLETSLNEIDFMKVKPNELAETAEMYWGELAKSLVVVHKGITYMCDGVDPYTGDWISAEILEEFRQVFESVEVQA